MRFYNSSLCGNEKIMDKIKNTIELDKVKKSGDLFLEGYNCAQSVFGTYCEDFGIPFEQGIKMASSFGGGMGRLREVCGAVSAIFMIAGLKYGYTEPNNDEMKAQHYKRIQDLAEEFKKEYGTIICRELLNMDSDGYIPSKRTPEYYKERPCLKFIEKASEIIAKM